MTGNFRTGDLQVVWRIKERWRLMKFNKPQFKVGLAKRLVLLSLLISGLLACERRQAVGRESRPVRILTFPGLRGAEFEQALNRMGKKLHQDSGLFVELKSPVDYYSAVRALGDAEADFAFLNDLGFIAGQKLYGLRPRLQVLRNGQSASHRAQILIKPGIGADLSALAGRRMAYVEPYSVSGYFLAEHTLNKNKIKLGTRVFAGSHLEALRQVLSGQADALATYVDNFQKPAVPKDMRAALSAQEQADADLLQSLLLDMPIPNEPLVQRKNLDAKIAAKVIDALQKLAVDKAFSADLMLLGGLQGFKPCSAKDYAQLKTMLKDLGKNAEEALPGGWKLRCIHSEKIHR